MWPTSEIEPFASFINAVEKFVATSTPLREPWANSTAIEGDLAAFVAALKRQAGGDIGIHGSSSVTQATLGRALVDELHLAIAPVVHSMGRRLFGDGVAHPLTLTRKARTPAGYLVLEYRVQN